MTMMMLWSFQHFLACETHENKCVINFHHILSTNFHLCVFHVFLSLADFFFFSFASMIVDRENSLQIKKFLSSFCDSHLRQFSARDHVTSWKSVFVVKKIKGKSFSSSFSKEFSFLWTFARVGNIRDFLPKLTFYRIFFM